MRMKQNRASLPTTVLSYRVSILVLISCLVLVCSTPALASIAFIQDAGNNNGYPPGSSEVTVTLASPTTAGDLIIVSVGWGDQINGVTSVTDSAGNTYTTATGPTNWSSGAYPFRQQLFYAQNIKGGSDTITISMSGTPAVFFEARAFEYSGAATSSVLDSAQSAAGTLTSGGSCSAGSGFTVRAVSNGGGILAEDETGTAGGATPAITCGTSLLSTSTLSVSGAGDLIFAIDQTGGNDGWVMQAAAFKPAATTASPNSTPSPAIGFVGRSEGTANNANTSVTVNAPAGIKNGDLMLVVVDAWNSSPPAPSGWSELPGVAVNSSADYATAFVQIWQTGDPTSFTFTGVNYPKAVMRVYSGATGIDKSSAAPTGVINTDGPSFTLPALPATSEPDEEYVGFYANDNFNSAITGPSNLADGVDDQSQWASFDADELIANQGTAPAAETASITSGDWIGYVVTLSAEGTIPTPAPVSTPIVTPTPTPISVASPSSTPTPGSPISFIGRTEAPTSGATGAPSTATVNISNISANGGVENGDYLVFCAAAYGAAAPCPSGTNQVGVTHNSSNDYISLCTLQWASGDPSSFSVTADYPKLIMRDYRGANSVDAWTVAPSSAGANTNGNSFTIPALAATASANETYVGCFFDDGPMTAGPSDLGDADLDEVQWGSFDGDALIPNQGAIPAGQTATGD
jgi:hypothetical protein